MGLRLVVGLGNPGPRYAKTRHNIGFRLVERLAGVGASWKDFQGLGRQARREDLILGEPATFMNESGRFVQSLSRFYKVASSEILVCFDDVALPLGRIRIKPAGSSGGQKGMQSVIDCLGTDAVPRLRLGIGPQPPGRKSEDFVLERFSAAEEELLSERIGEAAQAIEAAATQGLEAAMNRYNKDS